MNKIYSQHDIAKLCNETDTAISRVVERFQIRPSITLGMRLLFDDAQKNEILHLMGDYRRNFPKVRRTQRGIDQE